MSGQFQSKDFGREKWHLGEDVVFLSGNLFKIAGSRIDCYHAPWLERRFFLLC